MTYKAVVIGSSTGGPVALESIVAGLRATPKALFILLQHLPNRFSLSMTKRLKELSNMPVVLMNDGTILEPGSIYIAPGDFHFLITTPKYVVKLIKATGLLSPSIDTGFASIAEHYGPQTIGVILTGMGSDGVLGSKAIKQVGGYVLSQDEKSSAIFGMPSEVFKAGFVDEVLPLSKIANRLMELVS